MKTTLYLIRHSETLKLDKYSSSDSKQIINEKLPLSVIGEKKAYALSEREELQNIDLVYSSNYVRAISTAKYIAFKNDLFVNIDERLNERKLGKTEGISKGFWLTQLEEENAKTEGGESRLEVTNRMASAICDIVSKNIGKNIAIVSHATAITFLLMKWCELKEAKLEGKIRHLTFQNKEVINGSFEKPMMFKIIFEDSNVIDISLII